jgi:hypothetical protein
LHAAAATRAACAAGAIALLPAAFTARFKKPMNNDKSGSDNVLAHLVPLFLSLNIDRTASAGRYQHRIASMLAVAPADIWLIACCSSCCSLAVLLLLFRRSFWR